MNYKFIRRWFSGKSQQSQEIMRGAIGAFALKILAACVAFGYNVLLARFLGVDNTGIYFLSFTIVFIGATIGRFGLDNTVLRYISIARNKEDLSSLRGIYHKANLVTAVLSIIITVILAILSDWISGSVFSDPNLGRPLQVMALSVTPIALFTIHASALQGMKRVKEYVTVLSLWNPLFASIGVLLFVPLWGVEGAVLAFVMGSVLTLVISYVQWKRATAAYSEGSSGFDTGTMLQSCVPLFASSLLRLVIERSSIIFLGMWVASKDVGIFSAAYRVAMLTSLVLVAVNGVSAPLFATLYEQGKISELEHTARTTAKILMIIATPILVGFVLFSGFLMSVFGQEFIGGASALIILAAGQYVNLITGSVGYLLVMSGNEKLMRNNLIFSAGFSLVMNMLLIPIYGVVGAAIATALTVATQNLIATYLVKQRLGFIVLPFIARANNVNQNG